MRLLAIDPGCEKSAWVVMDCDTYRPMAFGKEDNGALLARIAEIEADCAVIEMVASYGMAVGREVFETCLWIGRFIEALSRVGLLPEQVYRRDEKLTICGDSRAKDANIRRALIDRFAEHDRQNGKGTKSNPDWFYGFHADVWQAYAVGVTWLDGQRPRRGEVGKWTKNGWLLSVYGPLQK